MSPYRYRVPLRTSLTLLAPLTLLAWLTPLGSVSVAAQVTINEFMASNETTVADGAGEFDDWIEVYNPGPTPVDLAGYYLSDDPDDPLAWQIPATDPAATTMPAGGFLLLWADKDEDQGATHLGFKLSGDGETISLTAPDGLTLVDEYAYGPQLGDVSLGRLPGDPGAWDAFAVPTPGAPNDTPPGAPSVAAPTFSVRGGFHAGAVTVALAVTTPGATVHYTTDGSVPDEADPTYEAPLTLSANTPLRARGFAPARAPSAPATETYLFDARPSVAVVAYTADPFELFDPATGMYPNFGDDIEIDVNVELYEPDGTRGFNQRFESEIQGFGSASIDQKSLALKAKSSLGSATVDYRVFPNVPRDRYRSLTLRNSGQDNDVTQFRDVLASSLVLDVADAPQLAPPEIYGQHYRPTVTYINGAYWGILNLRERTDRRYVETRFGLGRDEIDLIEGESEVKEGTIDAYEDLRRFLRGNSLASAANFASVAERLDVGQYVDYLAFNVFVDNQDWPGNNVRRVRERVEGAPWRHLTYDLDFTFGLFVPGQPWNSGNNQANALGRLLTPNGYNHPNPEDATLLARRLFENAGFRAAFVNRLADQLNLLYGGERISARIDALEAAYRPEIARHGERWGYISWDRNLERLRAFADGRDAAVREHVIAEIAEVTGTAAVAVGVNDAAGGEVVFSTVTVGGEGYVGTYFTGVDIPVAAVPAPGYVFAGWSGALADAPATTSLRLGADASLTANFTRATGASAPIVINEVNYNSPDAPDPADWVELHNPTAAAVDLSGWGLRDSGEEAFVFPAGTTIAPGGYLVLAESSAAFAAVYPAVAPVLGDFGADPGGFGLSGKGEAIALTDASGAEVDALEYDDEAPWPEAPDGSGPTLQLTDPTLDNALATSWKGAVATPGAANVAAPSRQPQAITFAGPGDRLTTDPAFGLEATASSGLPVAFVLVGGPAALAGDRLTLSGQPGTVTVRAEQAGDAAFAAAPAVTRSFAVRPPVATPQGAYCGASGEQPWEEWIARVQVGGLDRMSRKDGYADFTAASARLTAGQSVAITLTAGYSWEAFEEHFAVWIDYDRDGAFDPLTERAYGGVLGAPANGTPSASLSGAIDVPAGAPPGRTRMRVAMRRGAAPLPCGDFDRGEVEDYAVEIAEAERAPGGGAVEYCASASAFPWHEWLSRVRVGDLDVSSGKDAYRDFDESVALLTVGEPASLTLETTFSWATADQGYRIWIDYDGDGVFATAERVFEATLTAPPNGPQRVEVAGGFTVPAGTAPGRKRMRVSMSRGGLPEACGSLAYGEVEDYRVEVLAPAPPPSRASGTHSGASPTGGLGLYPNPATESVLVAFETGISGRVRLYDQGGRLVGSVPAVEGQRRYRLDVTSLAEGVYGVSAVHADGTVVSGRLVVRR